MIFEKMWEKISNDLIEEKNLTGTFTYIRDDGFETKGDMKDWTDDSLTCEEVTVLDMGSGYVLDLACGFGKHLKYMKRQGKVGRILGVEYNEKIVQYDNNCGIPVVCDDMCHFMKTCDEMFDTVLIMGNSIAECGSLERIQAIFEDIYKRLEFGGRMILSYKDYQNTTNAEHRLYQENNRKKGKYGGCVKIKLEYQGMYSEEKEMCYLDQSTLYHMLDKSGFCMDYESKEGNWYYTVWCKDA